MTLPRNGSSDSPEYRHPVRQDTRLAWPVAAAWIGAVAVRNGGAPAYGAVVIVSLAFALVALARRAGRLHAARRTVWGWAAVMIVIHGALAFHHDRVVDTPWLSSTQPAHVLLTVTGEPKWWGSPEPDTGTRRVSIPVHIHSVAHSGQTWETDASALLVVAHARDVPPWRSEISTTARMTKGNPSAPDVATLSVASERDLVVSPAGGIWDAGTAVRDGVRDAANPLPAHARGLIPAMVTGDTSQIPPQLVSDMRAVGMTHITAVSGTNCSIIALAVLGLCAAVGVPRRWRPWLCIGVIGGFLLVAHPTPSVVRAAVMGTVAIVARFGSRPQAGLSVVATTVLGCLLLWPELALSWGFGLSVMATAGIVMWAEPWGRALHERTKIPVWAGAALGVPLAATVACAPVTVVIQGSVSWVGILANVVAEPCIAPATIVGLVAGCVAPVHLGLAQVLMWLAAGPAEAVAWIASSAAHIPGGSLPWWAGEAGGWCLAALVAGVSWAWRRGVGLRVITAVLTAVGCAAWASGATVPVWGPAADRWVFVACDVGQGDALLIRTGPSSAVMVDVGPRESKPVRCLERFGVKKLDAMVLSHFHADHVGGIEQVLSAFSVPELLVSPVREPADQVEMVTLLATRVGVPVHTVQAGEQRSWGMSTWAFLGPARPPTSGSAANNGSVVCAVRTSATDLLLAGDVEVEASAALSDNVSKALPGWRPHVLKVPHHGSRTIDPRVLTRPAPELAVVSVGKKNRYGHPHPWVLDTLSRVAAGVGRTDLDGDVAVAEWEDGLAWVKGRRA